ncbi:MAG: hypothetical protein HKN16_09480 [Saprospiraceae bacterium]|nr:hypothetical protein [Saprospiraceae bacterium]
MKKIFTLIAMISMAFPILSQQIGPYNLTVFQETYVPLDNGMLVESDYDPGLVWDDPVYPIQFPFTFSLFEFPIDTLLGVGGEGVLSSVSAYDYYEVGAAIIPLSNDFIDRAYDDDPYAMGVSPIRYQVDGTEGSRIFKLETSNAGFYDEYSELDSLPSFVNFQIWMFEQDGSFELRYGESEIVNPEIVYDFVPGPLMAIVDSIGDYDQESQKAYFLTGDPSDPEINLIVGEITLNDSTLILNEMPANGMVYRFYTPDASVSNKDLPQLNMSLVGNPVEDIIQLRVDDPALHFKKAELLISNSLGQIIEKENVVLNPRFYLEWDSQVPGAYFLTVRMKEGMKTLKFIAR